jgi:nucleoside-diphosphate-sugar epimerase
MNVLIIGGNRFVGKLLAQQLIRTRVSVTLINRTGTGPEGCTLIKCDRNSAEFSDYIENINPDVIVDMCLYTLDQYESMSTALHAIDLKKYIFVSSIACKFDSFGEYGLQKKLLNSRIRNSLLPYIILQPTYIIGESDHSNRLSNYIECLLNDDIVNIDGDGDQMINFIDANDMCDIINKLIYSVTIRAEYELGCNEMTSLNDLIYRLSKHLNRTPIIQHHSDSSPYDNVQCFAINFKVKRDMQYTFNTFDDTLKRICDSYEYKS